MAPLLDTASLITDAEQFNKSSSTAAERVKLLQFAQDVEAEILAMRRWWFLWVQRTHSFSAAQPDYNMAADIASVDNFANVNGALIRRVSPNLWQNVYKKSTVSDTPLVWFEQSRDASSQVIKVEFWPIPNNTENGSFDGRLHAIALSDAGASYSKIPEEYRSILSIGMHERMATDEEKVQLQKDLLVRRDNLVSAMIVEDDKREGSSP